MNSPNDFTYISRSTGIRAGTLLGPMVPAGLDGTGINVAAVSFGSQNDLLL